ncbi:calcium-binding protein [Falsiroseomonas oryzae]|uniref:calcium-binding protein n=1 Tax=Falsiroseomonas oryzae TaxID=2766473 RepID=UPI0022EABB4F|nr:calcium-binding protein [Roseomonas sp. MO-31]
MSSSFGATTAVQFNPRQQPFTAGPTAPYAVNKTLTAYGDAYTGNWQGENIDAGGGHDYVFGGGGMDYLDGNAGHDTLNGGDSHDALRGRAGNDSLVGGSGNDDLQDYGTPGIDTLDGGADDDAYAIDVTDKVVEAAGGGIDKVTVIVTGAATYTLAENVEYLQTGAAFDIGGQVLIGNGLDNGIAAGAGNDSVYGMDGHDGLFGEDGNDYLHGGQGNDWLEGGSGNDVMEGSVGDDTYIVQQAGDVVVEYADAGIDEVRTDLGLYKLGANVENLSYWGDSTFNGTGNELGNKITGGLLGDQITGMAGNDTLDGGVGNDFIWGGTGADSIRGGLGRDTVSAGTENDTVFGGYENDSIYGDGGNDYIDGEQGNDSLMGDAGSDQLWGGAGDDNLFGGMGADTLGGGDGNDRIDGGAGRDLLMGGIGVDTFCWASLSDSTDLARDTVSGFESNDIIDLYQIDADTTQAGDQAFNFVAGGRPFFTSAGDLWLETTRGGWTLKGDVNGDGAADLAINFTGTYAPTEYDFVF